MTHASSPTVMTGRMVMAALRGDRAATRAAWADVRDIVDGESADDKVPFFLHSLITDLVYFATGVLLEAADDCESRAQDILLDHQNAASK